MNLKNINFFHNLNKNKIEKLDNYNNYNNNEGNYSIGLNESSKTLSSRDNKRIKTPKVELENLNRFKDEDKFTLIKNPKIKRNSMNKIYKEIKEKINLRNEIEYEGNNQ
jgi:hypothetical protein